MTHAWASVVGEKSGARRQSLPCVLGMASMRSRRQCLALPSIIADVDGTSLQDRAEMVWRWGEC